MVNDGFKPVFVGVYAKDLIIDKLYIDIDGGIAKSLPITQKFVNYLKEKGYTIIIVCTGIKGFHIYIEIKPFRVKLVKKTVIFIKNQLKLRTLSLIYDCFGIVDTNFFDTHVMGDIDRLTRVPETLRPDNDNKTYCAFMPYASFEDLHISDIYTLIKNPVRFNYPTLKEKKLTDIPVVEKIKFHIIERPPITQSMENLDNNILKNIIRPCLFRHLNVPEPLHTVRVAATVDLLRFYSIEEIISLYSKLNWVDWDEDLTRRYIDGIKNKNFNSYSCSKLRSDNIPRRCCVD